MGNSNAAQRQLSDAELMEIAGRVQPEDFQRVEPPAQVWPSVLIGARDDMIVGRQASAMPQRTVWGSAVLKVAAAIVVLAGVGALITSQLWPTAEAVTIASASMDDAGLPVATDAEAWAAVICENDDCWVEVDFTTVPDSGADALELWVIDANVENMHSLGFVTESGRFALPAGVLPEAFPIVDISVEPLDGVETHSGLSVLRGSFEPA